MTTKNIPESDTYAITKNNRPVKEAIDITFTNKTKKERGNQTQYSFNETTNELCFEKESVGRATVFMDRNIVDLSIEGRLDWVTLYTDPVGYRTFGFYAKDPSRLGFVCFTNYTLSGYEFETKRPEFSKFSSEKIRLQYDGEGWNIYDEDTLLGKVTPEDFPHSSANTSEMIPMIGFKIDSSTTLPHSIVVKGYRKSTDVRLNVSGNVERADYTKTDWVAYETLVSADSLNNIENELEYVSNITKTLDVALESHTNNEDIHVTKEKKDLWDAKETTDGAQAKATKALNDAKTYVDNYVKESATKDISLSVGSSVVSSEHDTPVTIYNVQGRTLVNVLGRAGACESVDSVINSNPQKTSVALDSTTKAQGSSSIKVTQSDANYGIVTRQLKGLAAEKPYVFVACFRSESASLPVHAELWGTAGTVFDRVITNEWAPQFFLLRSHTTYKELYIWAKSAGTFNIDAMRLFEITEDEYNALMTMTPEQAAEKYPYVEGMSNIVNPYVEVTGENLLPPFTEWFNATAVLITEGAYSGYFDATSNRLYTIHGRVNLLPNTTYTLSADVGKIYVGILDKDGSSLKRYMASTDGGSITFTTPPDTAEGIVQLLNITGATNIDDPSTHVYGTGRFKFENVMLTLGAERKPFKPQQKSLWAVETQLAANPIDGSNADVLYTGDDGLPYVLEKWAKVTLDGSLPWEHDQNLSGFKPIRFNYKGMADVGDLLGLKLMKYDGTVISRGTKSDSADVIDIDPGGKWFFVSVANSDSGWGQDYVPTADEIKAYFMGWKMGNASGGLYNGSGTKYWTAILEFGVGVTTTTTTLPTMPTYYGGWKPYRLQYLKATPTVVPVKNYELGVMLSAGNNVVEVGSGIVIREKAKPALNDHADYYTINSAGVTADPQSKLKYKNKTIKTVYRNEAIDSLWGLTNTFDPYGTFRAVIKKEYYDPTANYHVTYTMLEPTLAVPISSKIASNLREILNDTVHNVTDLQKQVSVLANKKADSYDKESAAKDITMPTDSSVVSSEHDTPFVLSKITGKTEIRAGVGLVNVKNPYVEVTGGNQLPPYVGNGSLRSNSTYIAPYEWYTPANGNGDFTNVNFKVTPYTEYTIGATLENALHGVITTDYGTWIQGYTHVSKFTFNSGSHTELSYIFKASDKSQASRVKDSILVVGSEAKPFKPQQKSIAAFECELAADPTDGTKADELYMGDDGLPYVLEKWAKITLDNSYSYVTGGVTATHRVVEFSTNAQIPKGVGAPIGIKYDGTILRQWSATVDSGDFLWFHGSYQNFYLTVNHADTGWGASYNPTAAEIQAYFMGWKMAHNNGFTPYTEAGVATHGIKVWIPLAGFNGGNGSPVLPSSPSEIAVANGWKPYRLQYLKTTPTTATVKNYELGAMLSAGSNLVNVGSGIVIREKVTPKLYSLNGNYYINNTGVSGSLLKNKVFNILKIYRNSSVDGLAKIENDANAYGKQHVRFSPADFNPSAVYTVTYTMLEPTLSAPISGKVPTNLRGTLSDTVQNVADLQKQVNVLNNKKADKGAPQWCTPTLLNNWVSVDYTVARYQKDDMGNVILDARVKNGVIGYSTPILILPAEYRPVRPIVFKVHCLPESITATVVVDSTGRVYCSYGSNTELNLYLMFKVD